MTTEENKVQRIIVTPTKSVGVSLILTFLLGPLGMLYSTIAGGIIMMLLSLIIFIPTMGLGFLITWPIAMIWGAMAVSTYNRKLLAEVAG